MSFRPRPSRHDVRTMAICWAIGIALALLAAAADARGQDVPRWVIAGIAAVETGTEWRDLGDVRGSWSRGAIGEVGPWQLSPAVLHDLRAYDRRFRIHADPVLAESLTRAWLLHLYARTGAWREACAAYHAGLGRRHEAFAIDYADRVHAAGGTGLQTLSAAGAAR